MSTMTIRDMDDDLSSRLRALAARHGRSVEDEAKDILRTALSSESVAGGSLYEAIRARVSPLGGVELELPPREGIRQPPDFAG